MTNQADSLAKRLRLAGLLGLVFAVVAAAIVIYELAVGVELRDVVVLIVASAACFLAGLGCLVQWRARSRVT